MTTLQDLGLSKYEARAYRSLLRTGPTTAKDLSRASEVPMGRVYDVLNSLEQHSLVRTQTASRPKKYAPVEPDAALERLLEAKREELRERERQYEAVVEELSDEMEATDTVDERFWTAAVGTDETTDLLLERIAAAERSVVFIAGSPGVGFDLVDVGECVVDELENALDRGVDVQVLLSPDVPENLSRSVGRRYAARLADHDGFEVRISDTVEGTFNVFDDVEVCVEVPNPLDPDELFAMIDLKDPEFAADVSGAFEPTWEAAREFSLD